MAVRVGAIYLLSGFGGSILSCLFLQNSISVGASGALFGLLGAMLSELLTNWTIYTNKVGSLFVFILFLFFSSFSKQEKPSGWILHCSLFVPSPRSLYLVLRKKLFRLRRRIWPVYITFRDSSLVLQAAAIITLLIIVAINLAVGILPHVDNFAHIGGFFTGFLLGFVLLIRPQFGWLETQHLPPQARVKSKHSIVQYVFCAIALVLLIAG